jgi:hypothetical protein
MNHIDKIEPHARRLEEVADKMDAAGIGGDPVRGHVVTLRRMAGDLRANAVRGKIADAFLAAADKSTEKLALDDVNRALDEIGASNEKRIEFKNALATAKLLG